MRPDPNVYIVPMRKRRGFVTGHFIVDVADYDWVVQYRWVPCGYKRQYVGRYVKSATSSRPDRVFIHRDLMGLAPDDPLVVDHVNGNPLDNRRCNLRIVTQGLNLQNMQSLPGSSSRYRGVTWDRDRGKWSAQAKLDGRNHNLGRYHTEEEAARIVAEWRALNMPGSVEALRARKAA